MRIAVLTSSLSRRGGGIFDVVRRSSQVLQSQQGANVTVFGFDDEETLKDRATWEPIQPRSFIRRGPSAFSLSPAMLSELLESNADIVHLHGLWQYPSVASLLWTRRTGRPHLITPHGMLDEWAVKRSRWKKRVATVLFERANLDQAACVHALCVPEAKSIRHFGVQVPICVIPNGVDLPTAEDEALMAREREAVAEETILYLGRLHPKKGLTNLIRGWAAAQSGAKGHKKWVLSIAGWDQGGYESELKALASDLGVSDTVQFPGPLFGADKTRAFARASAFVLPSLSEGVPMAVLEAWAFRLPALITPECNLPEAFAADAAVRIESNADSIAGAFQSLLAMPKEARAAIGQNGRRLVERQFTWTIAVEQMVGVYRWITGNAPPPPVLYAD